MMFGSVFIGLAFIALAVSILSMLPVLDDETRVILAVMGFVVWAVWALNAGSVTAVSDGVTITESYTSLTIVGGLFALLMAVSGIMRALKLMDQ